MKAWICTARRALISYDVRSSALEWMTFASPTDPGKEEQNLNMHNRREEKSRADICEL